MSYVPLCSMYSLITLFNQHNKYLLICEVRALKHSAFCVVYVDVRGDVCFLKRGVTGASWRDRLHRGKRRKQQHKMKSLATLGTMQQL